MRYEIIKNGAASATGISSCMFNLSLPVPMCTSPTISIAGTISYYQYYINT